MLTYEDCVGMSALTPDEVIAVAQHEHLPVIVAAELGDCLCETPGGLARLVRIFKEDFEDALMRRDYLAAGRFRELIRQFPVLHPAANQCREEILFVLEGPCN